MLKRRKETEIKSVSDVVAEASQPMEDDSSILYQGGICYAPCLSTGSTLWNLALSGRIDGGWTLGHMHRFVGGPQSGKSMGIWTAFAEALHNSFFDGYDLHYRDVERANQIGSFLFSKDPKKIARILTTDKKLRTHDKMPVTIQDWRLDMHHIYEVKRPFIYGLDSFDSLSSIEEQERLKKADKAIEEERKGKEGGYRTEKAVHAGVILREACSEISRNNSILILVSQTRANVGVMFGDPETTSGGNAPEFYATTSSWLHVVKHIKRRDQDVGVLVQVKTKKNKQTGKIRVIEFPILFDYGINDIWSMINWMVQEGFWQGPAKIEDGSKIDNRGDFPGAPEPTAEFMRYVALDRGLVDKLKSIVAECWSKVEAELATNLPPKYED